MKSLTLCESEKKKKNRKATVSGVNPTVAGRLCFGFFIFFFAFHSLALKRSSQLRNAHQHYFTWFLTSPFAYRAACLLLIYIKKKKKSMCIVE